MAFTVPNPGRTSEDAPVFEALMALAAEFAELPRPYIVVHSTGAGFVLQLMHPSLFEAWREALRLPADKVQLHVTANSTWLSSWGRFRGVAFELTGHGVPLLAEQAEAPRVAAESSAVAA
ncbi:hypothetical protein ACIP6Q_39260 [Streptomyces bobili]|uniref:hypothetical protein n=1 Tax=Streptomyces bobili TaxID=67280 RepID=UPI003815DACF